LPKRRLSGINIDRCCKVSFGSVDVAVEVGGNGPTSQPCALKFLIQATSAKFPYRIRMVCGQIEIRLLNLKTIGRLCDDELIINAGCGMCANCDPSKADRREYQAGLNEQHGLSA
jgi:hypothetical protein